MILTRNVDVFYDGAENDLERAFWKLSIERKLSLIEKNSTWALKKNAQNILTTKGLFKVKDVENADKSVLEKAKA